MLKCQASASRPLEQARLRQGRPGSGKGRQANFTVSNSRSDMLKWSSVLSSERRKRTYMWRMSHSFTAYQPLQDKLFSYLRRTLVCEDVHPLGAWLHQRASLYPPGSAMFLTRSKTYMYKDCPRLSPVIQAVHRTLHHETLPNLAVSNLHSARSRSIAVGHSIRNSCENLSKEQKRR